MKGRFFRYFIPRGLVWLVAIRYIRSSKGSRFISTISLFSLIGVTLSVATLIVVMSVMTGFRLALVEKIVGFGSHVSILPRNEGVVRDAEGLIGVSIGVPGVVAAHRVVQGQGMIINRDTNMSSGIFVNGLEASNFADKLKGFELAIGCREADFADENSIVLTSELARKIGATLNSQVILISPQINRTLFGIMPRYKGYKVGCIVRIGMYQYDEVYSFMNFDAASKFFRSESMPTMIDVAVNNVEEVDSISTQIASKVSEDYMVSDWKMENATMIKALMVEKSAMFLILSLFVGVAMFAIFSNLSMMVNDKTKSIAILKSLGMSRLEIGQVFFLSGFIVSGAGTITGSILGALFANNIKAIKHFLETAFGWDLFNPAVYFLSNLPSETQLSDVAFVVALSLLFAILASVFPAVKASKKEPAILLKYF